MAENIHQEENIHLEMSLFHDNPEDFTIVDVRGEDEARDVLFPAVINIPLHQLRERIDEIPTGKQVLVHCAGGYRSGVGRSIIQASGYPEEVYDLGEEVKTFQQIKLLSENITR